MVHQTDLEAPHFVFQGLLLICCSAVFLLKNECAWYALCAITV